MDPYSCLQSFGKSLWSCLIWQVDLCLFVKLTVKLSFMGGSKEGRQSTSYSKPDRLDFTLYRREFKMLTLKTIMSQIRAGDWFVTINLKDAYFHIQVIYCHRNFLRFAFGGKAYRYKVLPFGLALAPRTFIKCMDAALAPLRLQGIHILSYLDDWLILAHSRELVSQHRDVLRRHILSLVLRMNAKKSVLIPSQQTVFLGVHLDSIQMQARLSPARISTLNACLAFCEHLSQTLRLHGCSFPGAAPGATSYEAVPLVAENLRNPLDRTSLSPSKGVA